ncbi:MAG: hypothetical protein KDD84_20160, partial [Caldilineaceae bacterium]|nr:hypothetical protein [Caldilineaceae bacterium]
MSEQNSEAKKPLTNGSPDPEDMLDIEVGKSTPTSPPGKDTSAALPMLEQQRDTPPQTGQTQTGPTQTEPTQPTAKPSPRFTAPEPAQSVAAAQERPMLSTTYPAPQVAVATHAPADEVDPWAGDYQPAQLPEEEAPSENWLALIVRETLETVVLAVVIFLLIRVAIQNYRIEGS